MATQGYSSIKMKQRACSYKVYESDDVVYIKERKNIN